MKTYATYFQNSKESPVCYGEINLINPPRQRLRGEEKKTGIKATPVFCGFCGTDMELMRMGQRGELTKKFPEGETRLINGHEGVVWVESENRFAIVLIRGGDSYDPTRFTEDETYFEYGCDGADGLFCDKGYFNPDMLLKIPDEYASNRKLPLSIAKKLVFADPYACAVFQHERICDIGGAQNFRVESAKRKCGFEEAYRYGIEKTFEKTVIFGLGATGLFIGDQIRRNHPKAKILFVDQCSEQSKKATFVRQKMSCDFLCSSGMNDKEISESITKILESNATLFVGASGSETEHKIAFEQGVLGCNGIYDSFSLGPEVTFNSMPFGFKNHVILSSINFTQKHMEEAIGILCESSFDELVGLIGKDEITNNPFEAYTKKIYVKNAPLKTAVIWNDEFIDISK